MIDLDQTVSFKRRVFVIDLFCGAGGTSIAIHESKTSLEVVACINHDENAIRSHKANFPDCIHFTEDIRTVGLSPLVNMVHSLRIKNPGCLIAVWASLECTNHSKAKGGLSRDADSRSLAEHLFRYLDAINPEFVWIENVTEFLDWGPIRIKEGKNSTENYCELQIDKKDEYVFVPDKTRLAEYYNEWRDGMKAYGYDYDYGVLNAADHGAFQSRKRYFGQFAKYGYPIVFPEATHAKDPDKVKNKILKKWKAVKHVLHLNDEGISIFARKKSLSENTLKRIFNGLVKFVAKGDKQFIQKYFSGRSMGKVASSGTVTTFGGQTLGTTNFIQKNFSGNPAGRVSSIEDPAGSITTIDHHSVVKCIPASDIFLSRYNSGSPDDKVKDLESPIGTITTSNRHSLIKCVILSAYYGNGTNTSIEEPCNTLTTNDRFAQVSAKFLVDYQYKSNAHDLDKPCPTVTTKDKFSPVTTHFITSNFTGGGQNNSIDDPSPALTTVPKHNVTEVQYMLDNQYGKSNPQSIDQPSSTVTSNPKQNLIEIRPWLMNMNSSTSPSKSLDEPSPAVTQRTHRVVTVESPEAWIMNTAYNNVGKDLNEPAPTVTASKRHHYIVNPQWGTSGVRSTEDPSATIIARMDKAPPYLVSAEEGSFGLIVYEDDCETIVDIKMRMLNIPELLAIQGFPSTYRLMGNTTQKKKCIGNAVEVTVGKALFRALDAAIQGMEEENVLVS